MNFGIGVTLISVLALGACSEDSEPPLDGSPSGGASGGGGSSGSGATGGFAGAGSDGGTCTGTSTPCAQLSASACPNTPGCAPGGCLGICSSSGATDCANVAGCTWDGSQCVRVSAGCALYDTSPTYCTAQSGCTFSAAGGCIGPARPCAGLTPAECVLQPGCTLR